MDNWVFKLESWFNKSQRTMPWRTHSSPYYTWISEIMLQQTQVVTVIPYFERFITLFPTLEDLAKANQDSVLKAWEGLGYYSRARNLHKAAKVICESFNGIIPNDYTEIQKIPGIGPYTGAAIVSIAYEIPVSVVDGNVLRVFSRFWGIYDDIRLPKVRDVLFKKLNAYVGQIKPSVFNQAIMELGALICTPKKPKCTDCALGDDCFANKFLKQTDLPVKSKSKPVPTYNIVVGLIYFNNKLLIAKRKEEKMLGGLWEFPGGKINDNESEKQALIREVQEEVNLDITITQKLGTIKHAYSHFKINLHAYICSSITKEAVAISASKLEWINENKLDNYAFPTANKKLFKLLKKHSLFNSK
jgi:A/G-specific adenine glycosylase